MTSTLGSVPTGALDPSQAQSPGVQPSLSDAIANGVRSAPELKKDPATAVAVGAAGGTAIKAQSVAQAGKRQANATAQEQTKPTGTGIFGAIASGVTGEVTSALGKVAHYANDGLSTVQHEYRYLHDVEARHGMTAAIMEGAWVLGGAAAGTIIDPGVGTVLGAEAAAGLEGQMQYKDSWQRTLNPNYKDPHTGKLVSFGRDVAAAVGLKGPENTVISGALDGLGDLIADPLGLGGKALGEAHSIEGMGGVLGKRFQGLSVTAENVDQAYKTLPSVRRAFGDIATMSPADIAVRYPQFVGIANELGAAHTADEVASTFHDLAASSEMLDAQKLPTLAASRMAFRPLRDVVRNLPADAEGSVSGFLARHVLNNAVIGPRRWADRLEALPGATFDPETMDLSGTQINPANTRGLTDIYRLMRYGGSDREARAVVDAYAAATPAQRIVIVKNGIFRTLFAMAGQSIPEDPEGALSELVDGRTKDAIEERLNNHLAASNIEGVQPERIFGLQSGRDNIPPVVDEDGNTVQGAIFENQTGNISLPNIVEARRMAQAIKSSRTERVLAGTDDFLYNHVTQGFFKPLVLMSGGYGLHISLAEAIPNALRHGLTATSKGLYDRAIANLGYKADKEELGALSGWLYSMAGYRQLSRSQDAQYLAEVYLANEGYKTTTGVAAGEITQGETQQVERAIAGFRQRMAVGTKEGNDFSSFGNEDPRFIKMWQAQLREVAKSNWGRTAAQEYQRAIGGEMPTSIVDTEGAAHPVNELRRGEDPHANIPDGHIRVFRGENPKMQRGFGIDAASPESHWSDSYEKAHGYSTTAGYTRENNQDITLRGPGRMFYADVPRDALRPNYGRWKSGEKDAIVAAQAHGGVSKEAAGEMGREFQFGQQRGSTTEAAATEHARQAVVEVLRREPQDVKDNFVRENYKPANAPPGWDATDSHAQAIVDAMKSSVHGQAADATTGESGLLHTDLLQSVANGRTPEQDELESIDPADRPQRVKGRQVIPDGSGAVQRIANFGFRKVLNPMVNILSRNQEFAVEYVQARRALQDQVDRGVMTDAEAMTRAESQATTHVMRFVHNLHDRTQWTATMRNWAPFYFAQEQAYRRMGRLLAEDPGAFRRYQMAIAGVGHLSAQMQDGNGNQYIAFPGSGFIGKGTADIMGLHGVMVGGVTPAAFGGSLSSANVIFPLSQGFAPDLGPIAMVPASQLSTLLPELGKRYPSFAPATNVAASALNYVEGQSSQSQPIWEQLIPNAFVARMIEAQMGDDRAFNSSVMQAYQYLDYQQAQAEDAWRKAGSKGPAPEIVPAQTAPAAVKQAFVDKVRSYVRALYVARAITGLVSPVSSDVEITNFGFPQKLQDEINKAKSVNTGMSNFLIKYPNAVPYTVAQSYVPSDTDPSQPQGISLSSSEPAMQWIDTHQDLLNKYGHSALWLMPQLTNAKYSPTVYNEQIAQGLRAKDSPAQFMNALYTAAGDDLYYDGLAVHEQALTAAGTNRTAVNAEYATWDKWVQQVQKQYPVWAETFNSGDRQTNSQQAIRTLTQIFAANEAPNDEQSSLVYQLLVQYETAAAAYQQAGTTSSYYTAQSKIADGWVAHLDATAKQVPQLKPIIQSVFKGALKVQT